ncbi:MAG: sodium-dependent transporter [Planctomycetota bacterium]|jgi:NSS family neurotransmitter:Na+ symporter
MAELLEEQRESWGTRGGFILAAVGSAVGLGNLWGFPYKIYSYGGGAFLIPYITAMFCIGIPMLILEFSLGHYTQRAAPDAFRKANKKLECVGWWGIILGFVIITYYPVILAYCFSFMKFSVEAIVSGKPLPWAGEGIEGVQNAENFFYETYLAKIEAPALGSIRTNILVPLFIAWLAMYFCIFKGVKLVGRIVWLTVPLPWIMLLILTIRGLTLPGSMKGLVYYLDPTWEELLKPTTWRFAFGQVFFSLSLAFGVMLTYASFLHRKSDINNNAAIIGIADFATSFIAGLAIFATLGGMAFVTAQAGKAVSIDKVVDAGPGLAFVAFPYALAQLPGAPWWSLIFFFTLVTLGIDSGFSITESVLASLVDKTGWKRSIVLPVMSLVGLGFGLVYITKGGLNWLGTIDGFINGTWGIAFLGLLECIALGWIYKIDILRSHANERSDWKLGRWWNYAIRIFIPIVLGTLFFWNLFDDLGAENGFLRSPEGHWNWPNCVGIIVVGIVAPVTAIVLSMIKSRLGRESNSSMEQERGVIVGKGAGSISLLCGLISAVILILVVTIPVLRQVPGGYVLFVSAGFGLCGIIISSNVIDKSARVGQRPSWIPQCAGILSTLDISCFLSLCLIYITQTITFAESKRIDSDHLSKVSYVILSVVFL